MQFSRRAFLELAAKAGLALPFIFGPSACVPLLLGRFDRDTGFSLGYTSGDVTPDGAVVWLRAEEDSSVLLQYGTAPDLAAFASTDPVRVAKESDYTARFLLGGL